MRFMSLNRGVAAKICLMVLSGVLAVGTASAQGSGEADKDDAAKHRLGQPLGFVDPRR